MKCEDISKNLVAYLDRRANSAERNEMETHLRACPACAARAEEFRKLWTVLDEVPGIEPSFAFDAKLRQRIAAEPTPRWFRWLVPQPRIAVSMALLLALSIWMAKMPVESPSTIKTQDFEAIKDLGVLENYDVLTKFDALDELPSANDSQQQAVPPDQQQSPDDGGGS
ncbi:MAG TPA: zf-HC2 domain-containing protein [Candidatus Acidoferrales bacterium]|nr:zf-HC2 domain-containing protein [Candidatus Acidoferrales bacterium]